MYPEWLLAFIQFDISNIAKLLEKIGKKAKCACKMWRKKKSTRYNTARANKSISLLNNVVLAK
jgi:hypothetical protein